MVLPAVETLPRRGTRRLSSFLSDMPGSSSMVVLIRTGSRPARFNIHATCTAAFNTVLREGAQFSSPGSVLPLWTRDRRATEPASIKVNALPTITAPGSVVFAGITVPGARGRLIGQDLVLRADTTYSLTLTNRLGSTQGLGVELMLEEL